MWICIRQWTFQAFSAKDDHETMPFPRLDDDLRITNVFDFLRKQLAEFLADGCVNPSGTAICHHAFGVERAKVCAGGDITRLQFDAQP